MSPSAVTLSRTFAVCAVLSLPITVRAADNICAKPEFAGSMLDELNKLDGFKSAGLSVIDMKVVTTRRSSDGSISCHATLIFNKGGSVAGSFAMTKNIADRYVFVWEPDGGHTP